MSSLIPVGRERGGSTAVVAKSDSESYPLRSTEMVKTPSAFRRLGKLVVVLLVLVPIGMIFLPWTQNVRGQGYVSAVDPQERPQDLESPIDGRVVAFHVVENQKVVEGQLLVTLGGIDPELESRLEQTVVVTEVEIQASEAEVAAEKLARKDLESERDEGLLAIDQKIKAQGEKVIGSEGKRDAVKVNRDLYRQQVERNRPLRGVVIPELDFLKMQALLNEAEGKLAEAEQDVLAQKAFEQQYIREKAEKANGYEAKLKSQDAKISKAESFLAMKRTKLIKAESDLAAQGTQKLEAPRDGLVFRLRGNALGTVVKRGQPLLRFVPDTKHHAVEVWVDGNDAPLVSAGRSVRLQFEGWPAIQFSGWPAAAVGTFGGHVAQVDSQANPTTGMFRVLVVPDLDDESDWPPPRYLRQGVQANAWILLEDVSVGFEIWRQLNGFPPRVTQEPEGADKGGAK